MNTGFLYGTKLAELLGLPADQAAETQAPLLGAAVEIKRGVTGRHICVLHAFVDSSAPMRLGDAAAVSNAQSRRDVAPYAFIVKPARALRGALSQRTMALSNRALLRMAKAPPSGPTTVNQDSAGAYSSLPLDGYERDFVPGVTWLAMSFNCAAVAAKDYTHFALWLERSDGPEQMIANLKVDPAQMLALEIPARLFDAMKPAIDRAMASDDASAPAEPPLPFQIVPGRAG